MQEGTILHKFCESYLNGKKVKVPGIHFDMFKAMKDESDKITEIRNIESLAESENLNLHVRKLKLVATNAGCSLRTSLH